MDVEGKANLPMTYRGEAVDLAADCFGQLKTSTTALGDRKELHRRMASDGYLFFPGFLRVKEVMAARRRVLEKLAARNLLAPETPLMEGRPRKGLLSADFEPNSNKNTKENQVLVKDNEPLRKLLYSGPMMRFYEFFLAGEIRHFDFTWMRVKFPGINPTTPHYDIVFMGRGTENLYTSWTPLGNMPYGMGGLIVLENSHKQQQLKKTYGQTDTDLYCENLGNATEIVAGARAENRNLTVEERQQIQWNSTGEYSKDVIATRTRLGGRWLSAEFCMGDLLILSMYTMHASLDNHTDSIRLSSDSRYQLANEPADERWIGTNPPGHGIRAKRGIIC